MPRCLNEAWRRRALLGAGLALAAPSGASPGAPRAVQAFDAHRWAALQAEVDGRGRAALVVFSAGWCAVCPGLVQELAGDPRRRRARLPLWLVLTDGAPDEGQRPPAHHARVDRLLAFDGPEAALRHSVDPSWRGVVPMVALLRPGQPAEFVQGPPDAATLQRWFKRPAGKS